MAIGTKRLWLLAALACCGLALTGCTSIRQYEEFHPCTNVECPKCKGEKVYLCPTCGGRGWLPPSFSAGIGVSSHHGHGHGHIHHGTGFSLTFSDCPRCDRYGMVRCGTYSYYWKCRKCGTRYEKLERPCPTCGAK